MQDQEWLSLREAADALGISEVSARRWVKSGKLEAAQPGRKYIIPKSAVDEMLRPKAQAPPDADPKALGRREFLEHIKSQDREALEMMVDELDDAQRRAKTYAQFEDMASRGLMLRLWLRILDKPDAKYTEVEFEQDSERLISRASYS